MLYLKNYLLLEEAEYTEHLTKNLEITSNDDWFHIIVLWLETIITIFFVKSLHSSGIIHKSYDHITILSGILLLHKYLVTIQNTGNTAADAAAAIVITDTFDPRLTDLTVTLNGTALTAPTQYTYDAATGVFATAAGVVTVPAATFTQDAATGAYSTTPGTAVLTVTGTV